MAPKINLVIACVIGCVIASLAAILVVLELDAPILAFFVFVVIPPFACTFAGLKDRKTMVMISVYAAIGFAAFGLLQPSVAESQHQHARRIVKLPLAGNDWIVQSAVFGALFVIGRVLFVGSTAIASRTDASNPKDKTDSPA